MTDQVEPTGQVPVQAGQVPATEQATSEGQVPAGVSLESLPPDVRKHIADLRKEAAEARVKLKKLAEQEAEQKRAKMSAQEQLEAELASERARNAALLEKTIEAAVVAAAAEFVDPAGVLYRVRKDVKIGEDGTPVNIGELVTALKAEHPELLKKKVPDISTGDGARSTKAGDPEAVSEDALAILQRLGYRPGGATNFFDRKVATKLGGGATPFDPQGG